MKPMHSPVTTARIILSRFCRRPMAPISALARGARVEMSRSFEPVSWKPCRCAPSASRVACACPSTSSVIRSLACTPRAWAVVASRRSKREAAA
eukprot:3649927-Prymnesium_polylepis.1